jgi:TPR repeat protein
MQDGLDAAPHKASKAFAIAQAGAASGCYNCKGALARCYYYGYGVQPDTVIAQKLAEESAAANSAYGQFVFGRCIQDGKGGERDAAACKLYRFAAEQGLAIAQHYLGIMLYFGLGVTEDEDEAELLWYLAVLQGYKVSYRMLAYKYEKVQSNSPYVAKIFEAAANLGDANAQLQLGRMYEEGRGVFADMKKALKLYRSAMLLGHDGAEAALDAALTCGNCSCKYDRFARKPLLLPCGCTFCDRCIGNGIRGRVSKCPGCSNRIGETAMLPINDAVRASVGKRDEKHLQIQKEFTPKQLRRAAAVALKRPVLNRRS